MKKVILVVFAILSISSLAADTATFTLEEKQRLIEKVEKKADLELVQTDFLQNAEFDIVKGELDTELEYLKKMNEYFLNTDGALRIDISKNKDKIVENKQAIKTNKSDIENLKFYNQLQTILNKKLSEADEFLFGRQKKLNEKIETNKTAIENNKIELDRKIEEVAANIPTDVNLAGINNTIKTIHNDINLANKNIEANQVKISNLEHGISMIAAMDAANLSAVNKGELEIAGGVATYAGKQAIAFGVAYAPINGLSLNLKSGFNFGKTNFWAASAGAKYKFNLSK